MQIQGERVAVSATTGGGPTSAVNTMSLIFAAEQQTVRKPVE